MTLPRRRLQELEEAVSALDRRLPVCVEFRCRDTGRRTVVRGTWDPPARRYVPGEVPGVSPRRVFFLYKKQYDYFKKIIASYDWNRAGKAPAVQDVIVTAGRRAGKSSLAAAVVLFLCVRDPGTVIRIIGKRKLHGRRIMDAVRRCLYGTQWTYDSISVSLTLFNFSKIETSASDLAKEYDVGGKCHLLVYDEAALMHPDTYAYMSPSVVDYNGINLLTTTHRGFGWVYDKVRQAKMSENKAVVHLELSALENTFLSEAARARMEQLREVLSESAYASEVLGIAVPEHGLAFPDFSTRENVFPAAGLLDPQYTSAVAAYAWGTSCAGAKALVGCDFNSNHPNYAVLVQFDEGGGAWIVGEYSLTGTTDQFGVGLADYLASCGLSPAEVVLVADGSGEWQAPTGKKFAWRNPSFDALRAQGWVVRAPNADGRRANPLRWQRLEVTRTLVKTGAGMRHLHVAANCQQVVDMFTSLPMDPRRPSPDPTSKHAHIYDACSYPIFRVWGTSLGAKVFGRRLVAPLSDAGTKEGGSDAEQQES